MGSSNHSSYNGKGSTTVTNKPKKIELTKDNKRADMLTMLRLLEEVEERRNEVEQKKYDLQKAEKDLQETEKKVARQVERLSPEDKARFRRMLGDTGIGEGGQDR